MGPRRAGGPTGDPGEGRLRIGAKFEALSASQQRDEGGRGTVRERPRALRARASHPVSDTWLSGQGLPSPQEVFGGSANAEARAKRRPSVQRGKTELAQNKLALAPKLNITVNES